MERMEVLKDYLQKLEDSGNGHKTRMEIAKSAVRKFYRQVTDQEAGGQELYRSSQDMAKSRRLKNLLTKSWFKSRSEESKKGILKHECVKKVRKESMGENMSKVWE